MEQLNRGKFSRAPNTWETQFRTMSISSFQLSPKIAILVNIILIVQRSVDPLTVTSSVISICRHRQLFVAAPQNPRFYGRHLLVYRKTCVFGNSKRAGNAFVFVWTKRCSLMLVGKGPFWAAEKNGIEKVEILISAFMSVGRWTRQIDAMEAEAKCRSDACHRN